ncbi:site-specific integrase [Maribellus maritimus]|uniref:site-specific integrase n=1 Tax=Maribellus maritimus TaxID=2870838 RepID=UPI001EEA78A0|nr:site-specific integrase [Maribellus maritimus]MCG6190830.1 site-specific integrase [Maribellus maritimus]
MRVAIIFRLKRSKARSDGNCPVYVRCTCNGERFELSTGIFLPTESWDENLQRIKGKSVETKFLNNRIEKIRVKIQDIYNQLDSKGSPFGALNIKNKLLGFKEEKGLAEVYQMVIDGVEARLGKDFSYGTLKHYRTTIKRIKEFIFTTYRRKDIDLSMVDFSFINKYDIFLKSKKFKLKPNTVSGYHKHLRKVLNTAIAMNYLQRNPYNSFKIKHYQTNRDYLSLFELSQIRNKKISVERLNMIRDIFIFSCYTGLSYADIAKLKEEHVYTGDDGERWIIIDRSKTRNRCRIPLLPCAREILDKYSEYPENNTKGLLLPVKSNQKMNEYLKELADICGIQKNLSMHVARHTFATSVTLSNGVPIETVSKMLGHNSLKTTQIYARIVDKKIAEDMKKLKEIM